MTESFMVFFQLLSFDDSFEFSFEFFSFDELWVVVEEPLDSQLARLKNGSKLLDKKFKLLTEPTYSGQSQKSPATLQCCPGGQLISIALPQEHLKNDPQSSGFGR